MEGSRALGNSRRISTGFAKVGAWAVAVTLATAGCVTPPNEVVPAAEVAPQATPALNPRGGLAWAEHFPNVELTTHNGDRVRFYEDLLKGKVVIINFMYATCTDS